MAASPAFPPIFDDAFRSAFADLLRWRRDVRWFRPDPVDPALLERLVELACLAPSVGHSQPWRFTLVEEPVRRSAVRADFERCSRDALAGYQGERAQLYARLKLSGLDDAPVQLAVFADEATSAGGGLGQHTMPETLRYSTATAVHTLWLAARAWGIGVGWVSILEPERVKAILEVPESWSLVAYLCVGYPRQASDEPELARLGWQGLDPECRKLWRR